MYYDDFRALIRRNQVSNADVRFWYNPKADPNTIEILDRKIPRRKPHIVAPTGYTEEDYFRDSKVCSTAFFNGEIPMEGHTPQIEEGKLADKPYRGALAALEMLIHEGSLRRSDELRHLFTRYGRRFPDSSSQGLASS